MKALLLVFVACTSSHPEPRYAPVCSAVTRTWVTAPKCTGIPLVRRDGVVIGCLRREVER